MAGSVEFADSPVVDMYELSRPIALAAGHRLTLRQGRDFVRAKTLADAVERGGRDIGLLGDLTGPSYAGGIMWRGPAKAVGPGSSGH